MKRSAVPRVPGGDGGAALFLPVGARRIGAFVVDLAVALLLFLAPWVALGRVGNLTGEDWYWVGLLLGLFFFVSIPALFILGALALLFAFFVPAAVGGGRTVGKALFGLAVADVSGRRLGTSQLLRREWLRAWRLMLVVPGIRDHVWALDDERGQTFHDRREATVVVRARRDPSAVASAGASTIAAAAAAATLGLLAASALLAGAEGSGDPMMAISGGPDGVYSTSPALLQASPSRPVTDGSRTRARG